MRAVDQKLIIDLVWPYVNACIQMQELTSTLLQVEDELKTCQQDIELLKLSTPL